MSAAVTGGQSLPFRIQGEPFQPIDVIIGNYCIEHFVGCLCRLKRYYMSVCLCACPSVRPFACLTVLLYNSIDFFSIHISVLPLFEKELTLNSFKNMSHLLKCLWDACNRRWSQRNTHTRSPWKILAFYTKRTE